MPNSGDTLFRNGTDDWFNAPPNSTALRAVASAYLQERSLGGVHTSFRWVDFAYSWMEPLSTWGDQSFWTRQEGYRFGFTKSGVYSIFLTYTPYNARGTNYATTFNVAICGSDGLWKKSIGFVGGYTNVQQKWAGTIVVEAGDCIRIENANANGAGEDRDVETIDWTIQVIHYENIGTENPDEILGRDAVDENWENKDADIYLGNVQSVVGLNPDRKTIETNYYLPSGHYMLPHTVEVGNTDWYNDGPETYQDTVFEPGFYECRFTWRGENVKEYYGEGLHSGSASYDRDFQGGIQDKGHLMHLTFYMNVPGEYKSTGLGTLRVMSPGGFNLSTSHGNRTITRLGGPF